MNKVISTFWAVVVILVGVWAWNVMPTRTEIVAHAAAYCEHLWVPVEWQHGWYIEGKGFKQRYGTARASTKYSRTILFMCQRCTELKTRSELLGDRYKGISAYR